jgi:hypothetical protein
MRVLARFDGAQTHTPSLDELLAALRPALLQRREGHFNREARLLEELLVDGTGRPVGPGSPCHRRRPGNRDPRPAPLRPQPPRTGRAPGHRDPRRPRHRSANRRPACRRTRERRAAMSSPRPTQRRPAPLQPTASWTPCAGRRLTAADQSRRHDGQTSHSLVVDAGIPGGGRPHIGALSHVGSTMVYRTCVVIIGLLFATGCSACNSRDTAPTRVASTEPDKLSVPGDHGGSLR